MSAETTELALTKAFARGQAGASRWYEGVTFEEALANGERWRPTLAGRGVKLMRGPGDGYSTRQEAIAAAEQFRGLCLERLALATEAAL